MKNKRKNRRLRPPSSQGFTLLEMMLVVALIGLVILGVIKLWPPIVKFYQRSQFRQQSSMEARICMETIERVLSNGKAGTLTILTPPTTPTIPNSQIQFLGVDGSSYTITWSTAPMNTVHLLRVSPASTTAIDSILATNVTALIFAVDYRDPSVVTVTFQMTTPLDSSGSPDSYQTILLPSQTIRMTGS